MFRKIGAVCLCLALAPAGFAADLPTDFDPDSKYRLDYSDLDTVLKGSVLKMGPSSHQRATKPRKGTASRVSFANPSPSRLEGNRVMFDQFKPEQVAFLEDLRDDLLAIPSQVPIEKLKKSEQLAYWYNLHNAIVLAHVAEEYPITRLGPFFDETDDNAFFKQKLFDLNGTRISLKDIQDHVVENWQDPLVIYGFYMGAVGTPNVRDAAYTGNTVFDQLNANAVDFVNSVRGTQVWKKKQLRVATYYQRMAARFPNFERDVIAHVRKYAKPSFLRKLDRVETVSAEIEDWNIADLYNGHLGQSGGGGAGNVRDGLGLQIITGLPDHVVELLRYRDEKIAKQKREGVVDVEEVIEGR